MTKAENTENSAYDFITPEVRAESLASLEAYAQVSPDIRIEMTYAELSCVIAMVFDTSRAVSGKCKRNLQVALVPLMAASDQIESEHPDHFA